jgi:hypothetical protein
MMSVNRRVADRLGSMMTTRRTAGSMRLRVLALAANTVGSLPGAVILTWLWLRPVE